jgi:LemA protein
MRKGLLPIGVILLLVLIIGGWFASNYNRLVTKQTEVRTQFSQVESQLLRRNDLIPNLVETVKGFASQERAVFGAIADARARMAGARSPSERIAAGQAMDTALGRLFVVVENYPQLRSSENFQNLQFELAGTENRLAQERRRYNEIVGEYNVLVRRFPNNIFAGIFGFGQEPFYPVSAEEKQVPRVKFDTAPGDTTR